MKGAVVLDVSQGKERARIWPSKRGKAKQPSLIENQTLFRNYSWAIKYLAPEMMVDIYNARQGTPILPRDLAMMMLSGTLLYIVQPGGKRIYSMAALLAVSQSLDTISQVPGVTLIRGEKEWQAIPYSPSGQPWWWAPPDISGWTFLNNSGGDLTYEYDPNLGLSVECGGIGVPQIMRVAQHLIPDANKPWIVQAQIDPLLHGDNYRGVGIYMRDAITGRLCSIAWRSNVTLAVTRWTSLSGFGAQPYFINLPAWSHMKFWQIASDGNNLIVSVSPDGIGFTFLFAESLLTATGNRPGWIGIGADYETTTGFQSRMAVNQYIFQQ